jgi:two-component system, NtrC family, response regulator HydG
VSVEVGESIRTLVVDDDEQLLQAIRRLLTTRGFEVEALSDPAAAIETIEARGCEFELAVLDVGLPRISGLELLGEIRSRAPGLPVVMLTGDASADTAVKALRAGAHNYLVKPPVDPDAVATVLRQAAEHGRLIRRARDLERRVVQLEGLEGMVGRSPAMRKVYELIGRVAPLDINVLVLGESGTGKELVARAIHDRSERAKKPFVALNCAALPEGLVDSELFGHAKGAFTGAIEAREGAFQRAHGGTLFLDEIGDVPPSVQLRLLRALQEREVAPVGADRSRHVDVRVIAATLANLDEAVQEGSFRADLFYRLNVVNINLPPLRARGDDIGVLAAFFVRKHAERMGRSPVPRLAPEAFASLSAYDWPGNVRELENAIQRALALTDGDEIGAAALPERIATSMPHSLGPFSATSESGPFAGVLDLPLAEARKVVQERFERTYVAHRLAEAGGNISEAARRARLDRSNFRRLMRRADTHGPDS